MRRAKEGDKVRFVFSNSKGVIGIIKQVPTAVGDCWVIAEQHKGMDNIGIVYIQQFDMMYLTPQEAKTFYSDVKP